MSNQAWPTRLVLGVLCVAVAGAYACVPTAPEDNGNPAAASGGSTPAAAGSGGRASAGGSGGGGSSSGGGGGNGAGTGGSAGGPAGSGGGHSASGGAGGDADANPSAAGGAAGAAIDASGAGGSPGAAGPFPPGPHKVVLLVGDTNVRDQSRLQLIEILTAMKDSHGIVLEIMDSQMAKASLFTDKALVIAGPNNNYCSDTPEAGMRTMPVPLIVSRDCKTTAFGLGTMMNTQEYTANLPVPITIMNSEHVLAAGLTGVVPVLSTRCRLVRAANLGPDAIKIAKAPTDAVPASADSWAIFAYEKGGTMAGGLKAPAKRMGFFWHRPSAVTPEGKKLFQAAVEWSIRP